MRRYNDTVTQARLVELLRYSLKTGEFTWRASRGRTAKTGGLARCKNSAGYRYIQIDGKSYASHRLAWLYVFGVWPSDELDHINGCKDNNRISNLREAKRSENCQNRGINVNNTTGYTGVVHYKRSGKYAAAVGCNGNIKHLGYFDTPEEAHAAYLSAKARLHEFQPVPRDLIKSSQPIATSGENC